MLKNLSPDIKAIVSSGYSNDPVISAYQNYGFSGYLIKPYLIEDLERVINQVT